MVPCVCACLCVHATRAWLLRRGYDLGTCRLWFTCGWRWQVCDPADAWFGNGVGSFWVAAFVLSKVGAPLARRSCSVDHASASAAHDSLALHRDHRGTCRSRNCSTRRSLCCASASSSSCTGTTMPRCCWCAGTRARPSNRPVRGHNLCSVDAHRRR